MTHINSTRTATERGADYYVDPEISHGSFAANRAGRATHGA